MTNKTAIKAAIDIAIANFENHGIQPSFKTLEKGHLEELSFDTQRSTTSLIIQDPSNMVSLDNLVIPLETFYNAIQEHGYTLVFEGCSSTASTKSFKMVTLEYAKEQGYLESIPKHLQKRQRNIDDRCYASA